MASINYRAVYIYGLIDPRTAEMRYVGKTIYPALRLQKHVNEARAGASHPRAEWLRELIGLGMVPTMQILETTTEQYWDEVERRHISELRCGGAPLTNVHVGGQHGPRLLTVEECVSAARMYAEGSSCTQIGQRFGVSRSCILNALKSGQGGPVVIRDVLDRLLGHRPRGEKHFFRLHPEKVARGERNGLAKLSEQAVMEIIRCVSSRETPSAIARRFGVDDSLVRMVVKGDVWSHVQVDRSEAQRQLSLNRKRTKHRGFKLNQERADIMRTRLAEGVTLQNLADEFGVSRDTVRLVRAGKIWKAVSH